MSTARIEKMLASGNLIPVPRLAITDIKEDVLSKKLRAFDNTRIVYPPIEGNGVYINTNESGIGDVMHLLGREPHIHKSFHLGFSGWHNFDIIAKRRSSRALICDLNPENALFLSYALFALRACATREQFINQLSVFIHENSYSDLRTTNRTPCQKRITEYGIQFCANVSESPSYANCYRREEEVSIELERENSWLYTPERYTYLRKLALADKIVLITENICNWEVFSKIQHILQDNMLQIDTLYVSNISEWIHSEDKENFLKTIQALATDTQTLIIDARLKINFELTQRIISRQNLNSLDDWFYKPLSLVENAREEELEELRCSLS